MKSNKISAIINLSNDKEAMYPLTQHRPIAALPFSGRYRIVDFLLSSTRYANIESVAMFISGSGRSIYDHVRSGSEWDLNSSIRGGLFTFSQQNWKRHYYLTHEVGRDFFEDSRIFLHKSKDDFVIVMGGEVIHNLDINDLSEKHVEMGGDITLAYTIKDTNHVGFQVEGDRIVGIDEEDGFKAMNMDVYFMRIDTLYEIFDKAVEDGVYDDIMKVIQHYLKDYELRAYEYRGYAAKITNAQEFFEVNMAMLTEANYEKLFHSEVPIITRARSGPPAYYSEEAVVKNSQIATGSRIYGTVENSLIFRKVNVDKNTTIKNSIIMTGSKVGSNVHLEYVMLDKDVTIHDGVTLKGTKDKALIIEKGTVVRKDDDV